MKKEIVSLMLIMVMLTGILCVLTGCGKENNEGGESASTIEETTWTTPIISNGEYYYYIYDNSEIRAIRNDQIDYKLVYKPEYNTHIAIDDHYTIYNNEIYFIETDYKSDSDYTISIKKIDINGEKEATTLATKSTPYDRYRKKHYSACVTSKGIYYTIGNKMYMYDCEEQREITYNSEFTNKNIPQYFKVSDDSNIYYVAEKTLYMLSKEELKTLKEDINIKQYGFVKNGDNLYGCGATLGLDNDDLQYIKLGDYSINTIDADYKGNVFNKGNSIYLLSENKIYKLVNNKWVEHIDLKNYTYDSSLGGSTNGDIIFDNTVMVTLGAFQTKIYNYKEGFFYNYGNLNEENATKESYLLNEIKSTSVLDCSLGNRNDGSFSYVYREQNGAIARGNGGYTNEYEAFCTSEETIKLFDSGMEHRGVDGINIYDGYCYWIASAYNPTNKVDKDYILKKKCDGTEDVQKVGEIEDKSGIVDVIYYENYMHIITLNSIYRVDCMNNSVNKLYTHKYGKIYDGNNRSAKWYTNVAVLDKEVLIFDNASGHLLMSSYDGKNTGVQVFDRSYKIGFSECKIENGCLNLGSTKINLKTGKIVN